MKEIKAPTNYTEQDLTRSVFLAGSIEMGTAVDWQKKFVNLLSDTDITIMNPRRDDWDSNWVQSIDNLQFAEQVNWELNALNNSKLAVFYFAPGTMSPITLLELGTQINRGVNIVVCCPGGFWRKGNVDIVCSRHRIKMVDTIEEMAQYVKKQLTQ